MKNYKIKFNEYQMNIFNKEDFNGDKQDKLQSVLSYIMKYSVNDVLTKSINKLHSMYIRGHRTISLSYFKKLVNVLIDLKLLVRAGRKLIVLQEIEVFEVAEKVAKKVAKKNCTLDIENTDFANNFELHNYKLINNNNNYNIYNTTSEKFCPSKNDTFASIEQLKSIANDLYKNLKIRSNHVKTEVLNVIYAYAGRIYLKAARSYLMTVILDKKLKRDKEREEFKKKYVYNKNLSRTVNNQGSNYTSNNSKRVRQFTEAEIRKAEEIENDLLSWYEN